MPLRAPSKPPVTSADWDRWSRAVPVEPDPNTVGNDEIKDLAVTEPKLADGAVSTRAQADNSITDAKLRDSNALTVIGRSTNTNGNPSDIALDANGKFLVRRSNQLVGDTIQDGDIPATITRDTELTAAIAAHEAASDPHPGYTTAAELAAAITAHEGASNPHPTYLTQAEGDALYQPLTLSLTNAVDDAAAAGAGVAVGKLYRNGSVVMVRVT